MGGRREADIVPVSHKMAFLEWVREVEEGEEVGKNATLM